MKKKLFLLLIVLVMVTACRRVPQLADGGEAVVSFNNEELVISADDLYRELVDRFGLEILIDMIDRQILTHKFSDELENAANFARSQVEGFRTMFITDGAVDEVAMLNQLRSWYNIDTIEQFETLLELDFLRSLAVRNYAKDQVTERQIEEHYRDVIRGDIEAAHILIVPDVPANATNEQRREAEEIAREKAVSLIRELNAGANFGELAIEHSDDRTTAINNGELGWIQQGRRPIEFERAAWALEIGRHSTTPVQSEYGFHVILKTDEADKPELEAVRDDIIETLALQLLQADQALSINALIELRNSFGFRIEDSRLASEYSSFISNQLMQARGLIQ